MFKDFFIRNLDSDIYRENFLVSAIVSIFVIRIFLRLSHYPQIGRGEFHVAHLLFGGFFMTIAIIIMSSLLSKTAINIASILGGIGFGTFIDELGKFITKDNNYFFQPTIALIYIIFVLLYLALKFIPRLGQITQKEYLINALEMVKEAAVNDFDIEEEKQALEYLRHCDPQDPIVKNIYQLLAQIHTIPMQKPTILTRFRVLLRNSYYMIAKSGIILQIIIIFLTIQAVINIATSVLLFVSHIHMAFDEWGTLYSSILSGIFVIIGLVSLRFSKEEAYASLRISVLITILITQFFTFLRTPSFALFSLAINLFIYFVINYATFREQQKKYVLKSMNV